ncbi:MAG: T9SS type A sorting domain-containing protein, partial [Flavobacteriia bacterium]|nr:T9SS type A sorting domain-containing protein [Flavobacteriia bacterium]
TLNAAQYNFATNSQFRFQCDASANADLIYIDQVTITGISGTARGENNQLIALGTFDRPDSGDTNLLEDDFRIYPNPVKNVLNVKLLGSNSTSFKIINVLGQMVKSGVFTQEKIDVSSLENGMYILQVNNDGEVINKRFIKE